MAGLADARVWILVILTGASNCFPSKKALDPHRGYSVDPSSGSNWEVPARGFAYAESGSSAASNPSHHSAPHEYLRYTPASAHTGPVPPLYSTDSGAPPSHRLYNGSPPAGSMHSSFQEPPSHDKWAVPPPSPPFGDISSSSNLRFASENKPLGTGHASLPGPYAAFQPGELSYVEKTYDRGNYDSETEEQNPPKYTPVLGLTRRPVSSILPFGPLLDTFWFSYPAVDYMTMSKLYPPGTYTVATSSLDHGKNHWHDTHYINDPVHSSTQQLQQFPESTTHPSQSVQGGTADYELRDMTG